MRGAGAHVDGGHGGVSEPFGHEKILLNMLIHSYTSYVAPCRRILWMIGLHMHGRIGLHRPAILYDGAPAKPRLELPKHGLDLSVAHPGVIAEVEAELLVLRADPVVRWLGLNVFWNEISERHAHLQLALGLHPDFK